MNRPQKSFDDWFNEEMSRKKFLWHGLAFATALSLPSNWFCRQKPETKVRPLKKTKLKGLSQSEYQNINCMAEVFLAGSPVKNFDAGKAVDGYLYEPPLPPATEKKLKQLFILPSSVLAAIFLDFSLTPLLHLPVSEREKRLDSWRNSSLSVKRMAYNAFRQLCLMVLSGDAAYQNFTGYTPDQYFRPFVKI